MARIEGSLKSLIAGVSQQSEALRGPGHVAEMVNVVPDLIEGSRSRPGSEAQYTLKKPFDLLVTETGEYFSEEGSEDTLFAGDGAGDAGPWTYVNRPVVHFIDKSATERYEVFAGHNAIQVFDVLTGTKKTVSTPDGLAYLSGNSLGFLSINDYTFVYNKDVGVEEDNTDLAPAAQNTALVHIRLGDYRVSYNVSLFLSDGTPVATGGYTTPDNANPVDAIRQTVIAAELKDDLVDALTTAGVAAQWSVVQADNVLVIKRVDGADFQIRTSDNVNDQNIKLVKNNVRNFSDLPNTAPSGFVVEVLGDPTIPEDNYWVKAVIADAGNISKVTWQETTKPGVKLSFKASSAPHVLIREEDGTFTFREADWGKRVVGDEDRSPMPSFVGRKVDHMSANQGRLFIAAGSNTIASRSSDLFHFFRQTAVAELDDDPIDVSALYPKEVNVRGVIPWNESMFLFANTSQFLLEGGAAMTPKNTRAVNIGTYAAYPEGGFAAADDRVFVPFVRSDNSVGVIMWAAPVVDTSKSAEGRDITEHVPNYIKGTPVEMIASPEAHLLFLRTSDDPSTLYGFRWQVGPRGDLSQTAWFKLTFPCREVIGMTFYASRLFLATYSEAGELLLEAVELAPKTEWDPLGYLPCVDLWRRVTVTGGTTVSLPFTVPPSATLLIHSLPSTEALAFTLNADRTEATLKNALTGDVLVGLQVDDLVTMPEFFFKRASQAGGFETIPGHRLSILRVGVGYDTSGALDVTVQAKGQPERKSRLPNTYPQSGVLWAGVGARNLDARISVSRRGIAPMRLMFVRWIGSLIQQASLV